VVQLQNFCHRDQECRKLQIGYHNKISSGKFSFKIIQELNIRQKKKTEKVESWRYKMPSPNTKYFWHPAFSNIS